MPSRQHIEDPAGRVVRGVGTELGGFKKFLLRGNVVDLAVGIVIGAAFGNIVQALVKDIITPLISIVGGGPNTAVLTVTVAGRHLLIGDVITLLQQGPIRTLPRPRMCVAGWRPPVYHWP